MQTPIVAIAYARRTVITAVVLAAGLVACSSDDTETGISGQFTFDHDGKSRVYRFHKPGELPAQAPLLFVLHGRGQSSTAAAALGFDALAKQEGFAVAYPESTRHPESGLEEWNAGNDDATFKGVDDVAFLSTLAQFLQAEHGLDPQRTFASGFSQGGYMSYTLACQASDVFKAVAPVAALMDASVLASCKPPDAVPVIHFHGTKDWLVPIGGNPKDGSPGARAIIDFWAKHNGCSADGTAAVSPATTAHYYRNGSEGSEVHYYEIEDHDHVWPGQTSTKKGYEDTSGIDATTLIWEFFARR